MVSEGVLASSVPLTVGTDALEEDAYFSRPDLPIPVIADGSYESHASRNTADLDDMSSVRRN